MNQIQISTYSISDRGGRIAAVVTGSVGAAFVVIIIIQQVYRMLPPGVVASKKTSLDDLFTTRLPAFRRRTRKLQVLQANLAASAAAQAHGSPPQQAAGPHQQVPVSMLPNLL